MKYSVDNISRVFDDDNGDFYEIKPDADGLGCLEIIYFDEKGKNTGHRITIPPAMALLIAEEIKKQAEILIKKENVQNK